MDTVAIFASTSGRVDVFASTSGHSATRSLSAARARPITTSPSALAARTPRPPHPHRAKRGRARAGFSSTSAVERRLVRERESVRGARVARRVVSAVRERMGPASPPQRASARPCHVLEHRAGRGRSQRMFLSFLWIAGGSLGANPSLSCPCVIPDAVQVERSTRRTLVRLLAYRLRHLRDAHTPTHTRQQARLTSRGEGDASSRPTS